MLSSQFKINLFILAETMDPVSTKARSAAMNPLGSNCGQSIVPTHTFHNAPPLDVLIVPGGLGTRSPDLGTTRTFIKDTFPTLQYILTVCTGSALVAPTGVLDGRNATSNKASWVWATSQGPNVNWIPKARWTQDGNIWTSSGVAAGIDATYAFVEAIYGLAAVDKILAGVEYDRHTDSHWDPWGDFYNTTWPIV